MAGMCHTYQEIADELTRMEAEDGDGRTWKKTSVVSMLCSEAYIGNYLSNKKCRVINEDGTSKWVDNDGLVDQILIEGHHEALVSKELHEVVGELVKGGTLGGNRRQFSAEERETMSRAMKLAAREAKSWQMAS